MSKVISSFIPFPNIGWWYKIMSAKELLFDASEHFEKMTYRNKYFITGANGIIQLSIPLRNGRNQRTLMNDVEMSFEEQWRVQHWRSILSTYKRSPYFEYYEQSLEQLFHAPYKKLWEFNKASIDWVKHQLQLKYDEKVVFEYQKTYDGEIEDLRKGLKPLVEKTVIDNGFYYQLFEERNKFVPNLSILDLLFSEGPNTVNAIKENKTMIEEWINYAP